MNSIIKYNLRATKYEIDQLQSLPARMINWNLSPNYLNRDPSDPDGDSENESMVTESGEENSVVELSEKHGYWVGRREQCGRIKWKAWLLSRAKRTVWSN